MEMLGGYLYLHMDLGSGAVRVRASNVRLDDGSWHSVEVLRNQKVGTVTVDGVITDFRTPGK